MNISTSQKEADKKRDKKSKFKDIKDKLKSMGFDARVQL